MLSKKRYITKVIIINSLIYLLLIVVLELVFGKWLDDDPLNDLNVIKSQTFKIDIRSLYDYPDTYINYTRDSHGLRGKFNEPEEIDILTMGGSVVNLMYINDGETWQDVIQNKFKEVGKDVVVANAGTEGASSETHIKQFDSWISTIPGLKPEYILFYIGFNDMYLDAYRNRDQIQSVRRNKRKPLRSYIYENSAIYHFIYTIYNSYASPYIFDHYKKFDFSKYKWTTVPIHESYGEVLEKNLREYKKRLNILVDKTTELEATPVFVTHTAGYYRVKGEVVEGMDIYVQYDGMYTNGVDNYNILMRYNEATMSVCVKRKVICFDSAGDLIWEQDDFLDLQHMSISSMQKLGGYIFDNLSIYYEN